MVYTSITLYLAFWLAIFVSALIILAVKRKQFSILQQHYRSFLFVPWKLSTFLVAAIGLNAVGPFTGDPTWDFATASFMSILTFFTAPWTIGALFKAVSGKEGFAQVYVAICLWLFSASWSYDLYLLIRDGYYPVTWSTNLLASSILYLCAGLFWNLSFKPNRGVHFAFTEPDWPQSGLKQTFNQVFWYALPFMILVSAMILYFLIPVQWQ